MTGSSAESRAQRFRWRVVVVTLLVALPVCLAIWWHSPGGKQWRRVREAERWLEWATPTLRENGRFAKVEFRVSTREEIVLLGEVENLSKVALLGRLMEQLEPPCPVRVVEIRDANGEAAPSDYLFRPERGS